MSPLASEILAQALPYINKFRDKIFVIKMGGNALTTQITLSKFTQDIVLLQKVGIKPVIVHGGGPQITEMLSKLNIKSNFIDGLRVTTRETMNVIEMVLSGKINKNIVSYLNLHQGNAIGISGQDANLIRVQKHTPNKINPTDDEPKLVELGFVGTPTTINTNFIHKLLEADLIPVIAPIGIGEKNETYNINADTAAGKVAIALQAEKILFLTNVDGILQKDTLISQINTVEVQQMIDSNMISGGMIPKVQNCMETIQNGVKSAHILNGTKEHILLNEILTQNGAGTMIIQA